ncbi:chromate resistance protein ChrB domain-containing protein [Raoultella terrigena]
MWATCRRPWVDRLASAWLILRFIDTEARFIWLDDIASTPTDAVGLTAC